MNQNEIRKMSDRKRPHVKLTGTDGNAFAIMRSVRSAMREVGWSRAEISEFTDDIMSSDYNHFLSKIYDYCEVE